MYKENKQTKKETIGGIGEDLAMQFLKRKGYAILERNHRRPWGEIDIIARAPDATLVFVEVKTFGQSSGSGLMPEDNVTSTKAKKMRRAAEGYVAEHGERLRENAGWRIDVIAVELGDPPAIRQYENV